MLERLKSLTIRRIVWMVVGNIILSVGVLILKWSGLGNDPYTGMVMSLAGNVFQLSYGVFLIIINCFVFLIQILFGRKYIGPGTFVNWFLIGLLVDLYEFLIGFTGWDASRLLNLFGDGGVWPVRIGLAIIGIVVISFACSTYQTADAGIAPYDALSLIISEKTKIPYFWCRMTTDGICALVCFLTGGIVGVGMLMCAFGLGPIISFFNRHFSEKHCK